MSFTALYGCATQQDALEDMGILNSNSSKTHGDAMNISLLGSASAEFILNLFVSVDSDRDLCLFLEFAVMVENL